NQTIGFSLSQAEGFSISGIAAAAATTIAVGTGTAAANVGISTIFGGGSAGAIDITSQSEAQKVLAAADAMLGVV
ncbi:TPA: flagellin, partial [Aeromonas veronii]|nr:flagellin [Aeromonas veronii]HEA3128468.1 flagellin [Aeromonas veronii]